MQLSRIRPAQFYEEEGEQRRYYYHVDSQGRLFLEDMVPKNIATSLKSGPFLNFFFTQLRWNGEGNAASYAHKSPCGAELNFIASADTPIVMQDLVVNGDASSGAEPGSLGEWTAGYGFSFADSLGCPMHPSLLRLCSKTGRLYTLLLGHSRLQPGTVCLVRSALAGRLAEGLALGASAPGSAANAESSAEVAQAAWSWHEDQMPRRRRSRRKSDSSGAAASDAQALQQVASTGQVAAYFSYQQAGDAVMPASQAPDSWWWPVLELDRSAAPDTTPATLFEVRD